MLPVAVKTLQNVKPELLEGYKAVQGNKLPEAQEHFINVLMSLLLVPITSDAEAADVSTSTHLNVSVN